ncbi:hypothetical protein HRE53_06865 [Acaryochloris sp. 'Moss Beach']|uniref:hypothetical protein n=1 Tax=Acaryochloris sp. 'Moss Beach' TaxID=2740837 RepID=UPI001F31092F|nr:hypothetical protein [Acaryochloris sp. 'Moss Beach']UJB70770.1 hypothetical protein HRE53_06865 [Acaryochloris sp. 'Moss Beach']
MDHPAGYQSFSVQLLAQNLLCLQTSGEWGARAEDIEGDPEDDEWGVGSKTVKAVPAIAATPEPTIAKRVRYTNHPQELE